MISAIVATGFQYTERSMIPYCFTFRFLRASDLECSRSHNDHPPAESSSGILPTWSGGMRKKQGPVKAAVASKARAAQKKPRHAWG